MLFLIIVAAPVPFVCIYLYGRSLGEWVEEGLSLSRFDSWFMIRPRNYYLSVVFT